MEGGEDTQCGMLLVFPTSIREVILKELVFLEKMFSESFDQPNMRKPDVFPLTEHTRRKNISFLSRRIRVGILLPLCFTSVRIIQCDCSLSKKKLG